MSRRVALLGTWLMATVLATALAYVAVRQVAFVQAAPVVAVPAPATEATPTPATEATPTSSGAGDRRRVDLVGGSVTVRFGRGTTELVDATTARGFTIEVRSQGPERVDVRFRSDAHESRFTADQEGGVPDVRTEEDED
jgi:hypothetical protein